MENKLADLTIVHYSWTYRLVGILGVLLGGFFGYLMISFYPDFTVAQWIIFISSLGFIPVGIYLISIYNQKIEVDAFGMRLYTLIGSKAYLSWLDIAKTNSKGQNLLLSDQMGDNKITIRPEMDGYEWLIGQIRQKRPDLWSLPGATKFHRSVIKNALLIGVIPVIVLVYVYQYYRLRDTDSLFFAGIAACLFLFLVGYIVLKVPQQVLIEGDHLRIRYVLRERLIRAEDIQNISLNVERSNLWEVVFAHRDYSATASVRILLKNGERLELNNLNVGTVELEDRLRSWWEGQNKVKSS